MPNVIETPRLGTITAPQLQAALDRFGLGTVIEVMPVPFSNWGQNLFLTSTQGNFVLRGAPLAPDQFPLERYFIRRLAEETAVPVPWPYAIDPTETIFGWSYALMPRLAGLQIGDPTVRSALSSRDRSGIARAVGTTLAQMHRLRWPAAGMYQLASDSIAPFREPYTTRAMTTTRRLMADFQQYVVDHGRSTGMISADDIRWADALMRRAEAATPQQAASTLVMGDFHERNVVAEQVENQWRISGVFDFATSHVGDGEADLSRCIAVYADEDAGLTSEFLNAYQQIHQRREGFEERFALYMLFDRIHVWAFAYGQDCVWWDTRLSFRDWASPYLTRPM